MKNNKLSFDSHSDLEKEIEGELVEEEIKKESDLYHQILYTVIPFSHDFSLGIFPHDQQLSTTAVLLWDTLKSIPLSLIDNEDNKVIKVVVNSKVIRNELRSLGGGVYSMKLIPNTLFMEEEKGTI